MAGHRKCSPEDTPLNLAGFHTGNVWTNYFTRFVVDPACAVRVLVKIEYVTVLVLVNAGLEASGKLVQAGLLAHDGRCCLTGATVGEPFSGACFPAGLSVTRSSYYPMYVPSVFVFSFFVLRYAPPWGCWLRCGNKIFSKCNIEGGTAPLARVA